MLSERELKIAALAGFLAQLAIPVAALSIMTAISWLLGTLP